MLEIDAEGSGFLYVMSSSSTTGAANKTLSDSKAYLERIQALPLQNPKAIGFNLSLIHICLKAGGVGLNLTEADYVYIVDPWWNPAVEQQAIDRVHRIGQTKRVFAYRMICKDTIEEKIMQLQERKRALADDLISTDAGFLKKLDKDDILPVSYTHLDVYKRQILSWGLLLSRLH